jgi:hypothetical protein
VGTPDVQSRLLTNEFGTSWDRRCPADTIRPGLGLAAQGNVERFVSNPGGKSDRNELHGDASQSGNHWR